MNAAGREELLEGLEYFGGEFKLAFDVEGVLKDWVVCVGEGPGEDKVGQSDEAEDRWVVVGQYE